MKNFLITAMGRSGTRFLAENMNKSDMWTVKHEAGDWRDMRRPWQEIQRRFNRNYYGEVNSYLRFIVDKLNVEKKGIILRNPVDLWMSITTWHNHPGRGRTIRQKWNDDFNQLIKVIPHLLRLAESGQYYVIEFERMIKDLDYLKDIFKYFGIDNVRMTKKILETKVNSASNMNRRTSWNDFKPHIKESILKLAENYQIRTDEIFRQTGGDYGPESKETKDA